MIAAPAAADAANYDVVVSNSCGTATSTAVALTVNALPAITTQPSSQAACTGGSVTFSVAATGGGLTYQWRKDGNPIASATNNSYTINSVAASDAGTYTVVVSGTCTPSVTSSGAVLTLASTNVWTGVTSTNWATPSNWCSGVPTATSDITIPSGTPFSPSISTTQDVRNLTINSGATVTVAAGGRLNLYGNFANAGTMTATAGTVAFQGTANQTVAALNAGTVIMNGTGGITLGGNMVVGTTLTLTSGNITLGTNNITLNGSATGSTGSHIITNGTGSVISNNITTNAGELRVGSSRINPGRAITC